MDAATVNDVFFDTNVICYFASVDASKAAISDRLLRAGGTVSVQVLDEFVNATLNRHLSMLAVRRTLAAVRATCAVVPISLDVHERALTISERYKFRIYDSSIIAAALLAGCKTLFTEDLQNGQVIDGLTIRNPYSA